MSESLLVRLRHETLRNVEIFTCKHNITDNQFYQNKIVKRLLTSSYSLFFVITYPA